MINENRQDKNSETVINGIKGFEIEIPCVNISFISTHVALWRPVHVRVSFLINDLR